MSIMVAASNPLQGISEWLTGGAAHPYMTLYHCMSHDVLWITITVVLDLAVAAGYGLIAMHWWRNAKTLPPTPAKRAVRNIRNIFLFCGLCGYIFIPIKMFWPAWRLYDLFMAVLVYFTWRYAWGAKELKVVYSELGRSTRLEQDLERTREESKRKSFFLNAISHDLRTPLNGLMLQANLAELSAKGNDTETLHNAVQEIKTAARSAGDLLDCLLEYARLDWSNDNNVVTRVDLAQLIDDILSASQGAAAEKNLFLTAKVPPGAVITTDRMKVERILQNLVTNAIKFTERGGIRVEVEHSSSGVDIHVIDTGVGIPAELHERLFEEFFQVSNIERDKAKGFGLGLAIARRLSRQLSGDVTVSSAVGGGSRFSLHLPTIHATTREEAAPSTASIAVAGT